MLPSWPQPPLVYLVVGGCPEAAVCITAESALALSTYLDDMERLGRLIKDCKNVILTP